MVEAADCFCTVRNGKRFVCHGKVTGMLYDKDIREPLFLFLEERYGKVRFLEEKNIGRSRADIVMITENALIGIEIKSDADTYTRLGKQVQDYDRYYDCNYVVIGTRHVQHIEEHVPAWWGIITVEEMETGTDFYIARKPAESRMTERERQIEMLWRPELNRLLEINLLPKYAGKSKRFVQGVLLERVEWDRLKLQLCDCLFERDYTTIAEVINQYRVEHGKRKRRKRKPSRRYRKKP